MKDHLGFIFGTLNFLAKVFSMSSAAIIFFSFLFLLSPAFSSESHSHEQKAKIEVYQLDPPHSTLGFKVPHLGISSVTGKLKNFEGQLKFSGEQLVSAEAVIESSSIFTDNDKRDDHLRADDFLSSAKFPKIKFKSTKVNQNGKELVITGNLTIRDITKPIVLKGKLGGKVHIPMWKVHKTGLQLQGKINRQEFGLKFKKFLGTGEAMVGNEVTLNIEIEANRPE